MSFRRELNTPVVQTVEDAAIAHRVARMWPLLTVKG
jgi:hypothetical protein